ncbi:MAG: family 10 glycosylhydrolase, partial [Gemmatirosa sp.]|nr:family 10 glycosylhydrolase [Gemmatirosa sp.]
VHAVKPWVRVGISPFGIWRPGNPPSIKGLDAYDAIYADSKLWLGKGWLDYFVPQLYWAIDPPAQSFTTLLDWWTEPAQNPLGRPVWPGLASYRVDTVALRADSATLPRIADTTTFAYRPGEILRQVRETRARTDHDAPGVVLYNGSSVLRRADGALGIRLRDSLFTTPALVPSAPWLGETAPDRPTVLSMADTVGPPTRAVLGVSLQTTVRVARLAPPAGEAVRWWVVSWRDGARWTAPRWVWGATRSLLGPPRADAVAVWALSRTGVASEPAVLAR